MKISYHWLQTYFDEPLPPPEELQELFSLRAFEVEGTEKLGTGDSVLDIKVLPDRACYALSHRGIARELAAIQSLSLKKHEEAPIAFSSVPDADIGIEERELCTKFVARRMENVQVSDSPKRLQDALLAIGQRPINNIVDATNFVMFDIGRPLHAFDADKVKGRLTVRSAKKGEVIVTLDNKQVELNSGELVMADDEGPVGLAGIKGGKRTEVDANTKNIILEAANWNPSYIRRTATSSGIKTEASRRFENRISHVLGEEGIDAVTRLIASFASTPETKIGKQVIVSFENIPAKTISVDTAFIGSTLGASVSEQEVIDILARLGIMCTRESGKLLAQIPPERLDLTVPEDIVEEVGRIYGYEKIQGVIAPPPKESPKPNKVFYYTEKIKNVLTAKGFSEVSLYTLVPSGDIEVAKPLASDKGFLRTNLSFGMERSVKMNTLNAPFLGLDEIREFEIGKVFTDSGEFLSLAIGVSLVKKVKGKTSEGMVKEAFESLAAALGISLKPAITNLQSHAVGEVILENILETLPEPTSYADLAFIAPSDTKYRPFSPYPFIVRDVALFVLPDTAPESVATVITDNAGDLVVRGPELFDEFSKDGKKSLAFRTVFQSFDRTLQDEEVNKAMEKVYSALKGEGWEVR